MFEKYFNYYKDNCGTYNRIFIDMKKLYWALKICMYIILLSPFIAIYLYASSLSLKQMGIFFLIFFVIVVVNFNIKAKKIIHTKFGIKSKKFTWYSKDIKHKLNIYDKNEILNAFNKDKLCTEQIKVLLDITKKEVSIKKPKFPVIPSFIAALLVSLWNNYYSWMFSHLNADDYKVAIELLGYGIAIIIVLLIVYYGLKPYVETLVEAFYSNDFEKARMFYNIVEEIYVHKIGKEKT